MGPVPVKPDVLAEPLDLFALLEEANRDEGDRCVVSRAWLKRVYLELSAGRKAMAALTEVYGPGLVLK